MPEKTLQNIPTNIITGFLGVGKTTAILNLLNNKPAGERWAVLVNEFGEVGIDGSLLAGQQGQDRDIFVREVPGGCMCCAAGLPMQMALNMLLARAKPDRLLIEPTGLGHPEEVMAVLQNEHYQNVLKLQATITLVDPRKIQDRRYTTSETFNQQLGIADIIVAGKADLCEASDFANLTRFLQSKPQLADKPCYQVAQGELQIAWLQQSSGAGQMKQAHHHHHGDNTQLLEPEMPEAGYLLVENQGEGFRSSGWIFESRFRFDYQKLYSLLLCQDVERVKGVFLTDKGIIGVNMVEGVLTTTELDEALDSRIELIASSQFDSAQLEARLLDCIQEQ